jgi:predicted transcriptional regulator
VLRVFFRTFIFVGFNDGVLLRHRRKKRTWLQIAADILEIAKEGSRSTRIMHRGNLSFDLLRKYLGFLTESELLKVQNRGARVYVITERGRRFLKDFRELERYSERVDAKRRALEHYATVS